MIIGTTSASIETIGRKSSPQVVGTCAPSAMPASELVCQTSQVHMVTPTRNQSCCVVPRSSLGMRTQWATLTAKAKSAVT